MGRLKTGSRKPRQPSWTRSGLGQLTLVEHALCPLDSRIALREDLRYQSEYRYVDAEGHRLTARVTACFIATGQTEPAARRNAQRFAEEFARAGQSRRAP